MKLIVNPHKIEIEKTPVNEKEINITKVYFEFSDDYESDLVKEAIFTLKDKSYKVIISNNECDIPNEILSEKGQVEIGVTAYKVFDEQYEKRFNPSPVYITTLAGSIKEKYETDDEPTPSEIEQIWSEIADIQAEQIVQNENISTNASNIAQNTNDIDDLEANKQDKLVSGTNIKTINNQSILGEGNIEIESGSSYIAGENITIENNVISAKDTIYDDTEVKNDISNLKTNKADKSEIPDVSNFITKSVADLVNYYLKSETYNKTEVNSLIGAISTINFEVVQTLPIEDISTNTIYLLPRTTTEINNIYDEYIYISNSWELIGSTDIDLSNYQEKIDVNNKLNADLVNDTNSTNKFVTAENKVYWNSKASLSDISFGLKQNIYILKQSEMSIPTVREDLEGIVVTHVTPEPTPMIMLFMDNNYETYLLSGMAPADFFLSTGTFSLKVDRNRINVTNSTIPQIDIEYSNGHVTGISKSDAVLTNDLSNYLTNTDYATSNTGGVFKINSSYATNVNSSGYLLANTRTYEQYVDGSNSTFIGKGTLENVISGKALFGNVYLTTKTPVGIWHNGKTIYRKVISNNSITASPTYVNSNEDNIDEIINFYAIEYANNTNDEVYITGHPALSTSAGSNYGRTLSYERVNKRFKFSSGNAVAFPYTATIILEFTETNN